MNALWNKSNREADSFLLNNQILSDVKFIFPNSQSQVIYGHTFLLSKKSPVFYRLFHGNVTNEGITIEIKDVSPYSFLELLKYIYTEIVVLVEENVSEINYLANKYLIKNLQQECEAFVEENISIENVLTILEGSIDFKCNLIEETCVDFIEIHTDEILSHEYFLKTDIEIVRYLLAFDTMNCNEMKIFNLVIKWAEVYCAKNKKKITSLRGLFRLIRFPTMNSVEFAECIKHRTLFTAEEIGVIFLYISTNGRSNIERKPKCFDFKTTHRALNNMNTKAVVKIAQFFLIHDLFLKSNMNCFIQLKILKSCILTKIDLFENSYDLPMVFKVVNESTAAVTQQSVIVSKPFSFIFDTEILLEKGQNYRFECTENDGRHIRNYLPTGYLQRKLIPIPFSPPQNKSYGSQSVNIFTITNSEHNVIQNICLKFKCIKKQ